MKLSGNWDEVQKKARGLQATAFVILCLDDPNSLWFFVYFVLLISEQVRANMNQADPTQGLEGHIDCCYDLGQMGCVFIGWQIGPVGSTARLILSSTQNIEQDLFEHALRTDRTDVKSAIGPRNTDFRTAGFICHTPLLYDNIAPELSFEDAQVGSIKLRLQNIRYVRIDSYKTAKHLQSWLTAGRRSTVDALGYFETLALRVGRGPLLSMHPVSKRVTARLKLRQIHYNPRAASKYQIFFVLPWILYLETSLALIAASGFGPKDIEINIIWRPDENHGQAEALMTHLSAVFPYSIRLFIVRSKTAAEDALEVVCSHIGQGTRLLINDDFATNSLVTQDAKDVEAFQALVEELQSQDSFYSFFCAVVGFDAPSNSPSIGPPSP